MRCYAGNPGRFVFVAGLALSAMLALSYAAPAAMQRFNEWRAPMNAETLPGASMELNTPFGDGCPILSPDGLSLFIASNRPGGLGGQDIWVSRRAYRNGPWDAPVNLGAPVNSEQDDFCPTPTSGNRLFFVSARPGGFGASDIYVTRWDDGAWTEPRNLGSGVNSAGGEFSPSFFEDEDGFDVLYFSSNRAGGFAPDTGAPDADIYFSADFGPAQLARGLNTEYDDMRPNVRSDGREIVFDSTRPGGFGGPDIWTADRDWGEETWSAPVNLGALVNSEASETRASLSWDGRTLFFGSNRVGSEIGANGAPSNDIYFTTRRRRRFDEH